MDELFPVAWIALVLLLIRDALRSPLDEPLFLAIAGGFLLTVLLLSVWAWIRAGRPEPEPPEPHWWTIGPASDGELPPPPAAGSPSPRRASHPETSSLRRHFVRRPKPLVGVFHKDVWRRS